MELEEGTHAGGFVVAESPGTISRDQVTVTVAAATTLGAGRVLSKLAATGKYVPYDDAETDGSEVAAGVLYGPLTNDGVAPADMQGVVVNFGAEVRRADLVYADGTSDQDKLDAEAD